MNNRSLANIILSSIAMILLLCVLLLGSTAFLCYGIPNWWRNEYDKYNVVEYVNGEMSLDDAVYVTEEMLSYCIGIRDSLDDVEATIDGVSVPFFTQREKIHLADCRNLFAAGLKAVAICMAICIVLLIIVRKRSKDSAQFKLTLSRGYISASVIVLAVAAVITILSIKNFTWVFTKFHEIFFDNNYWILYPERDNLINLMHESVFSDAAMVIAGTWLVLLLIGLVISIRHIHPTANR